MSGRKLSSKACRRTVILTAAAVGLGGCADYVKRRDTVTFAAGEAQAWNRTVHVADPWPPAAANTRIDGDGRRVARAIERYEKGDAAPLPAPVPLPVAAP